MHNELKEITYEEMQNIDGGLVVWAFVLGVCVGSCFTAGVYYGYKKEGNN